MTANKVGYTATQVACGWTGAIIELTTPFGQEQCQKKIIKMVKFDQPTNRQMDGQSRVLTRMHATKICDKNNQQAGRQAGIQKDQ